MLADFINESTLLDLGLELVNHTQANIYVNPVDVATVIDLLEMLVNTQAHVIVLEVTGWTDAKRTYARAEKDFPRLEETEEFMNVSIKVKIQWYLKCFIRKCLKLGHLGVLNFPLPTRTLTLRNSLNVGHSEAVLWFQFLFSHLSSFVLSDFDEVLFCVVISLN